MYEEIFEEISKNVGQKLKNVMLLLFAKISILKMFRSILLTFIIEIKSVFLSNREQIHQM
jgi:hypothetical protein